jgi:hypothetical protein
MMYAVNSERLSRQLKAHNYSELCTCNIVFNGRLVSMADWFLEQLLSQLHTNNSPVGHAWLGQASIAASRPKNLKNELPDLSGAHSSSLACLQD